MPKRYFSLDDFRESIPGRPDPVTTILEYESHREDFETFHSINIDRVCSLFPAAETLLDKMQRWREVTDILRVLSYVPTASWIALKFANFLHDKLPEERQSKTVLFEIYGYIEDILKTKDDLELSQADVMTLVATIKAKNGLFNSWGDCSYCACGGGACSRCQNTNDFLTSYIDCFECGEDYRNLEYRYSGESEPLSCRELNIGSSFMAYRLILQSIIEAIYFSDTYKSKSLGDLSHLQNAFVKTWAAFHLNPEHPSHIVSNIKDMFKELTEHGDGPSAADFVLTPRGSVMANFLSRYVEQSPIMYGRKRREDIVREIYRIFHHSFNKSDLDADGIRGVLIAKLPRSAKFLVDDNLVNSLEVLFVAHNNAVNFTTNARDTKNVLVISDSVGAGHGLFEDAGELRMPQRPAAMQARKDMQQLGRDVTITNVALVGATTADGARRVHRELRVHKPHVVMLTQGGNDVLMQVLTKINGRTKPARVRAIVTGVLSTIKDNWSKMIRDCLSYYGDIKILLALHIPDGVHFKKAAEINAMLEEKLFGPMRAEFASISLEVLSLPEAAFTRDKVLSDGIHLNEEASRLITDYMTSTLTRVISDIDVTVAADTIRRLEAESCVEEERVIAANRVTPGRGTELDVMISSGTIPDFFSYMRLVGDGAVVSMQHDLFGRCLASAARDVVDRSRISMVSV